MRRRHEVGCDVVVALDDRFVAHKYAQLSLARAMADTILACTGSSWSDQKMLVSC